MSFSNRTSGLAVRLSLVSVALFTLAGFSTSAMAQTAPQLLPYTSRLIAGGGTTAITYPGTCPVSGNTLLDKFGDGCLATEIQIGNTASGGSTPGARSAVADANGNVFFTDYNNALVRRVDATTGIVTAVAGGGTAAAGTSTGALGTAVKLVHPAGIAFAPNGDLYFSDPGNGQVFKIAATGGFVGTSGIISLVAGNSGGTYGYAASNVTTTITPPTGSYLRAIYGIAFDTKGDLFMVDEYTEAILVLNTNATGTNTVNNVPVAAGTIWKVAGTTTGATAPYCLNGTATGYGCTYGLYTEDVPANTTSFDSTYSVAVDPNGVLYGGVEYYNSVFQVTPAGILSTFSGIQDKAAKPAVTTRAKAGSFGIGSIFGLTADANSNVYISDASSGVIWRVDSPTGSQYVVAGGATTVCSTVVDAYGDGCPATQAKFGSSSGTGLYATATLPGPGIYGVSVDAYSDLFTGDTETNLIREIASGTQFGVVGANQPVDTIDIHFAAGDTAATTGAYSLIAGATNFSLGTATCTTNSDTTTDCLLPITATPKALGLFTGTLKVASKLGGIGTFPLTGTYAQSPVTRTSVTFSSPSTSCSGTTYSTTAPITLTATLSANGPSAPTGTITFYSNGTQIGTPQTIANLGTVASPVYGATLSNTFSTVGTYTIKATYSGDNYYNTSTGTASGTITSSNPTFTTSTVTYQQSTIAAGQTALYSFNVAQNVYNGSINFTVSGLPANSSASFSPGTLTSNGCSVSSVVALSIFTQQAGPVKQAALGSTGGGLWSACGLFAGFGMALFVGFRRRKIPLRYSQLLMALAMLLTASGMMACGSGAPHTVATPSGTYTISITATGSAGTTTNFTVPLTVK